MPATLSAKRIFWLLSGVIGLSGIAANLVSFSHHESTSGMRSSSLQQAVSSTVTAP
jgi:hypothetical protein